MARLGPVSVLHVVTGEIVAVRDGEKEGEAVFTFGRTVEVYNLYDCRCVHSWPLCSTDHVTCHAQFHTALGIYCAVRNSNDLLLWKSEDKSLPSTPLPLPSSPLSLLTTSQGLVTVDNTGSVAMVTVRGGDVCVVSEVVIGGRRMRGKKLQIVTSAVCEVGGRECVLVICGGCQVYTLALDDGDRTGLTLLSTMMLSAKVTDKSQVAVCGQSLLVAGCDGTIYNHDLSDPSSPPISLSTTPSSLGTSITGVSYSHFTVFEERGVVSLRDTVYGTYQDSMETGLQGRAMVLWSVSSHVVICASGEGVRVCTVTGVRETSLATVLGRKTTPTHEAILVIPEWVEPDKVCSGSDELSQINQLCDPSKTPSLESVLSLFPSPPTLHCVSYSPLVKRLLAEPQFWAHSVLIELVKYGAISGSMMGDLVKRAVEQKDWALVVVALKQPQHVPESILVNLLHHTLELPEELDSYGAHLRREDMLWSILALPYSDSLMQQPLSELPLTLVLSLLQFVTPHVTVSSLSSPPPIPYPHLLDWLSLILDSHWTALALCPQAREVLKNFQHTTYHQMLFCENMTTVQKMLDVARKPFPRKPVDRIFSIERINLKI